MGKEFTLLDLLDHSLRLPEIGIVNFNTLYIVIAKIIKATGLDDLKFTGDIEDDNISLELSEDKEVPRRNLEKERLDTLEGMLRDMNQRMKVAEKNLLTDETDIEKLEVSRQEMQLEQASTKSVIKAMQVDLDQKVAYRVELEDAREEMAQDVNVKTREIKKLIREVEDSLVKRDDFEVVSVRTEQLEEEKVNRDELGKLLEPGFIDNFLTEQLDLRTELNELKEKVIEQEENIEDLRKWIEEDLIKGMKESFTEVNSRLETIEAKLSLLDPDEINDSFFKLEEQVENIMQELGELKASYEAFHAEAKSSFNKISVMSEAMDRLEKSKMDKSTLYELLEKKADIDMIAGKLDRNEFAIVVGNLKDDLERLAIKVKINEEEMTETFSDVRQELSLQMYKEDFVICTEPIRNRIKALIYELKRVKEIALTHLFPDAPGIAKCISCNRGAHMAGPKYSGDANVEFYDDIPPDSHVRMAFDKSSKPDVYSDMSFPPNDLDNVPFPPDDKPREKDSRNVSVLLAAARPSVGLDQEMPRRTIDKKLETYFSKKPVRFVDGEHTRITPQQRKKAFTTSKLFAPENLNVLFEKKPGRPNKEDRTRMQGGWRVTGSKFATETSETDETM